jgi:hypothetical protein
MDDKDYTYSWSLAYGSDSSMDDKDQQIHCRNLDVQIPLWTIRTPDISDGRCQYDVCSDSSMDDKD